ncbi:MAG: hypothetical protein R2867_41010 [Caldilineaceae bacterium]
MPSRWPIRNLASAWNLWGRTSSAILAAAFGPYHGQQIPASHAFQSATQSSGTMLGGPSTQPTRRWSGPVT